jgi:hypothetical protein
VEGPTHPIPLALWRFFHENRQFFHWNKRVLKKKTKQKKFGNFQKIRTHGFVILNINNSCI